MAVTPIDPNNSLYIFDNDAIAPRYPVYNTEQISNNAHAVWPSEQITQSAIIQYHLPAIEMIHVDPIFSTNERFYVMEPQYLNYNENGNGFDWVVNHNDPVYIRKMNISLSFKAPSSDSLIFLNDNSIDINVWNNIMKDMNCFVSCKAMLVAVDSSHHLHSLADMKLTGHCRILAHKVFHPRNIVELEFEDEVLPADQCLMLMFEFNWNSHVLAYFEQFMYPEHYGDYVKELFIHYDMYSDCYIMHNPEQEEMEETN